MEIQRDEIDGFGPPPAGNVLSVSQVTRSIRELLEGCFPSLRVRGEITNLSRPQSGHLYFSLVEDGGASATSRLASAQLPCVIWRSTASRLRFRPENGQRVVVSGRIGVYEPRGAYQLIGEAIEAAGVGELQLRFEELKERLRREGLFDPARKRPLPFLARRIGLVTSPTGAAVQDVLRAVLRRFPPSWVRIVPVRVQGEGAAEEIARAIELLQTGGGQVDVIVLARGGGSLEDLWAFNEERVARAIAASRLPTVSAVGHEVDFSIADFVADARAQTPTQAGDLVVPDLKALHQGLAVIGRRLALASGRYLERGCAGLERLGKMRPFREPQAAVQNLYQRCDEAGAELKFHLYNRVRQWDDALSALSGRLEALSPLRVLARGYSVVLDLEGRVVQNAALLQPGQLLRLRLAQGSAQTRVVDVDPSPNARQGAVMDAGGTSPGSSGSH